MYRLKTKSLQLEVSIFNKCKSQNVQLTELEKFGLFLDFSPKRSFFCFLNNGSHDEIEKLVLFNLVKAA